MKRKMAKTERTLIAFHSSVSSPHLCHPKVKPNSESIKAPAFSASTPSLLYMLKKNHTLLWDWEYDKFMILEIARKMVLKIACKVLRVFLVNSSSYF